MIYYTVPFDSNKNIGRYYNRFMEAVPRDNDWACYIDGDTLFTTPDYGLLLENAIKENPDADCFTAYTNRVGCKWQIAPGVNTESDDIRYHRKFGEDLKLIYGSSVKEVTDVPRDRVMSGFLFMLKKSAWKDIGGFKEAGMLTIDNDLHWKLQDYGKKFYLIKGLYLYHWYRGGNMKDKRHLL
jgi:GT2 family glycosyltransferase